MRADRQRPALTAGEQQAADSARQLLVNLTTYTRANFDQDYQRALAGTTGQLRTDQQAAESSVRSELDQNKHDIKGVVTAVGVESASGSSVVLLVVQDGYLVDAAGKATPSSTNRLQVTVTRVGGSWLLSNLTNVPLV
jgi:Mce-associated membrane protein